MGSLRVFWLFGFKPSSRLLLAPQREWPMGGRSRLQRRDRVRFSRTSVSFHHVNRVVSLYSISLHHRFSSASNKKAFLPRGTGHEGFSTDTAHKNANRPLLRRGSGTNDEARLLTSGFRPTLRPFSPPAAEMDTSDFVAGYSGATVPDFHGLPSASSHSILSKEQNVDADYSIPGWDVNNSDSCGYEWCSYPRFLDHGLSQDLAG